MSDTVETPVTTRRTLLCGAAVLAAGGGTVALAGCSSSGSKPAAQSGPVDVGAAADVPVGGGKVFRDQLVVVTQPTAGQFKAFSARCTHAGCIVDQVVNRQIQCPCHGSRFDFSDGSVQDGPAPTALPAYQVTVQNGRLEVTES